MLIGAVLQHALWSDVPTTDISLCNLGMGPLTRSIIGGTALGELSHFLHWGLMMNTVSENPAGGVANKGNV